MNMKEFLNKEFKNNIADWYIADLLNIINDHHFGYHFRLGFNQAILDDATGEIEDLIIHTPYSIVEYWALKIYTFIEELDYESAKYYIPFLVESFDLLESTPHDNWNRIKNIIANEDLKIDTSNASFIDDLFKLLVVGQNEFSVIESYYSTITTKYTSRENYSVALGNCSNYIVVKIVGKKKYPNNINYMAPEFTLYYKKLAHEEKNNSFFCPDEITASLTNGINTKLNCLTLKKDHNLSVFEDKIIHALHNIAKKHFFEDFIKKESV